ncbi:hypothetical protein NDU88_000001 [Pleurodeles waltl]|uniref:Uncharacterized protein n=1 Tax=Pleurodeles waltl TaxID=8319 RepID=A0AAV7LTE4_PLEWA|nr:hypothetical protein NDU88_000001 [Pleurodeles waltl]
MFSQRPTVQSELGPGTRREAPSLPPKGPSRLFPALEPPGVQRREACVTSPCGKRSQYRTCPVMPALFMGHAQDTPRSGKQRQVSGGASSGVRVMLALLVLG